jgi:hypothetical protein
MEDKWDIKNVLESQGNTPHGGGPSQLGVQESDFESNSESRTTTP